MDLLTRSVATAYRAVDACVSTALAGASAVRRARVFHPDGDAYAATLLVTPREPHGAPLLDQEGEYAAVARVSRGAGLPRPLPDVAGLALRILDAHGPGASQDLLVNSAGRLPLARHVLLPRLGPVGRTYSSVLPYRVGGRTLLFGATPLGRDAFTLLTASPLGPWTPWGVLTLGRRLPDAEADSLAFAVDNTGGGIAPEGVLQDLRRSAYRRSQAARP